MMNRRLASAQFCNPNGTQELRSPTPRLCSRLFAKSSQYFACRLRGYRATEERKKHTPATCLCHAKSRLYFTLRYIPPPLQTHQKKKKHLCNSSSVKTRKYRVEGARSCSIIQYQACDFGGNNTDSRVVTAKVSNVRVGCVRRGSHCAVQTVGENRD